MYICIYVYVWPYVAIYGYILFFMAIYGHVWPYVRLYIAMYGHIHPKICILDVWTCILDACTCILGVWTCILGAWTCILCVWTCILCVWTCIFVSGLVFLCLDLYFCVWTCISGCPSNCSGARGRPGGGAEIRFLAQIANRENRIPKTLKSRKNRGLVLNRTTVCTSTMHGRCRCAYVDESVSNFKLRG